MPLGSDPALPSRDVLLDVGAVESILAMIGRHKRASVSACTIGRVNYQVGRSLRAVLNVTLDGTPHVVAARMFREGRSASAYAQAEDRDTGDGDLLQVAWSPRMDTVFWLFPNDRKITALPYILDPASSCPEEIGRIARKTSVAYAPEKTATVACLDSEGRPLAYAKIAAAHQAERDFQTYRTLGAALGDEDTRVRLPAAIAYTSEQKTLWLEAMPGRRMTDPADDRAPEDLRRLGTAVAVFHGLPFPGAPLFDRFAAQHIETDVAHLRVVRPDVADAAGRLAERLSSTVPIDDAAAACLHGDLHPKNAIVSAQGIALIDLEDVAVGPPAADLGSMLAALLYLQVSERLTRAAYSDRVAAFLTGYADVRPLPHPTSLAWYTSAALFRERAVRAVTRIRPLGLEHLGPLVAEAGRLLDRGVEVAA